MLKTKITAGFIAAFLSAAYMQPVASQTRSTVELMPQGSRKILVGSIGGKFDIRMYLWREDKTLSGDYLYETNGGSINLEGTVDTAGNIVLKESDLEGKQ